MEQELPFGTFHRENGTNFSDILLRPEILQENEPNSRVPFTS